ncbi:hypothetical protein GCM10009754_75780 [Amycolatopsis minnesotensis]|uniref:Uncharacterized protein n=1 Tax=Amycolatopsis minnesotensis TaxID=337894 RepID=A0ABN2SH34_9PSEU
MRLRAQPSTPDLCQLVSQRKAFPAPRARGNHPAWTGVADEVSGRSFRVNAVARAIQPQPETTAAGWANVTDQ